MKNYLLIRILAIGTLFSVGCLSKKKDIYECPVNSKAYLTFSFLNEEHSPDDFTSGAAYSIFDDGIRDVTVVELGILSKSKPLSIYIKMDSAVGQGISYTDATVKESFIGINEDKYNLVLSEIKFINAVQLMASGNPNLEFYGLASGTFSGKFIKPGDADSTEVTGTFCYDNESR